MKKILSTISIALTMLLVLSSCTTDENKPEDIKSSKPPAIIPSLTLPDKIENRE